MFEDPKWKPIYIKRQWHKRRRRKRTMTFNNKQELIDKIKEKQENAFNDLKRLVKEQKNTSFTEQAILKGNVEAYEDVIKLIDSAKIVVYPEEIGKESCEPAPKQEYINNTVNGKQEIRNDRFKEFGNICIDAKSVDYIALNTYETGVKRIVYKIGQEKLELIHSICTNEDEEEKFYKTFMEEIEWWKYWKQN